MIYVIQSNGKGDSNADSVTLRVFESTKLANDYIKEHTQSYLDGHKYWTNFDIVDPGDRLEIYATNY